MSDSTVPLCEWSACLEPAHVWLRGQWTIFDWLDVGCCLDHETEVYRYLSRRHVDGELPKDVFPIATSM
jgi:hypothetical protein